MFRFPLLALLLTACPVEPSDSGKPADSGNPDTDSGGNDTADIGGDTADADTGNNDTGDTADVDTGSDTADGDTGDVDTGGDTADVDTGGDTADVDTGDPDDTGGSTACDVRDLVPTAEIRDAAGTAGTSFATTDNLSMVAILSNPCSSDITFDTPDTCLFTGASVTASSGMGTGVGVACGGAVTSWTIAAGASKEEAYSWGRMSADTYQLDVSFNIRGVSATERFEVL